MKAWHKYALGAAAIVGGYYLYKRFGPQLATDGSVSIASYVVKDGVCFESRQQPGGSFLSRPVEMQFCCNDIPDLPECGPVLDPNQT